MSHGARFTVAGERKTADDFSSEDRPSLAVCDKVSFCPLVERASRHGFGRLDARAYAYQPKLCGRRCRHRRHQHTVHFGSNVQPSAPSTLYSMKTVYLLRHGEALHNLVDRGAGSYERRRDPSLLDPSLTETGTSQALEARELLEQAAWPQLQPSLSQLVWVTGRVAGSLGSQWP